MYQVKLCDGEKKDEEKKDTEPPAKGNLDQKQKGTVLRSHILWF